MMFWAARARQGPRSHETRAVQLRVTLVRFAYKARKEGRKEEGGKGDPLARMHDTDSVDIVVAGTISKHVIRESRLVPV